jgi:peptidoglycan/xylan/chitin deacetylase (PgdA/CDA1 family)
MSVALAGRTTLQRADQLVARFSPATRGLLIFMFHPLFASEADVERAPMHPHERATPESLKRLFAYFRDAGYRFVGAGEIDRGLEPGGRYAHLTFDDGFASNLGLLELLPAEGVHATIFPSANHVLEEKAYWWNVVYRERRRRGGRSLVAAETEKLRRMRAPEVDAYLVSEFGPAALKPVGDADRPLAPDELRELGSSPWIEIGNHTLDHAVLTRCSPDEAAAQIGGAQRWLTELLGTAPLVIAYPDGAHDAAIVELSRAEGLRLGLTAAAENNRLPLDEESRMRLGRFRIVFDRRERPQMRAVRSSVQLAAAGRRLALRKR